MRNWLMKTEPNEFGIDDLANRPGQTEPWDGVRNYQARNMMRDEMKRGDRVFVYHSNCDEPGIVGIATIVREGYPDPTAFDPEDKHYDPKSDPGNPALVPRRREVRAQAPAHHHPRRAQGADCSGRHAAGAPREPALGDAGERGGVGVHPFARVTRARMAVLTDYGRHTVDSDHVDQTLDAGTASTTPRHEAAA